MNPRQLFIIATMAVALTLGGGLWPKETGAEAACLTDTACGTRDANTNANAKEAGYDPLLQRLGLSSPEQLYDALYNGQSLADIAASNRQEVKPIVELQLAELSAQLDARLAAGHISLDVHAAQKAELPELIERSVYGGTAPPVPAGQP